MQLVPVTYRKDKIQILKKSNNGSLRAKPRRNSGKPGRQKQTGQEIYEGRNDQRGKLVWSQTNPLSLLIIIGTQEQRKNITVHQHSPSEHPRRLSSSHPGNIRGKESQFCPQKHQWVWKS